MSAPTNASRPSDGLQPEQGAEEEPSPAARRGLVELLGESSDDLLAQVLLNLELIDLSRLYCACKKRLREGVFQTLCSFKKGALVPRCGEGKRGELFPPSVWRNLPTRPRKHWATIFFDLNKKHLRDQDMAFSLLALSRDFVCSSSCVLSASLESDLEEFLSAFSAAFFLSSTLLSKNFASCSLSCIVFKSRLFSASMWCSLCRK
mmetsp:Transcript_6960/g.17285  ORF Transcript_6960/g.17285 Transcript_6960/m.17285 type:complete len:205 (-) Transcript_6960:454-1068(-)